MLEEPGINTIHMIEGTWKFMKNTQMILQNGSCLTTFYMAKNWDQNENGYDNRQRDTEKSPK